jgi:hypothetical protein
MKKTTKKNNVIILPVSPSQVPSLREITLGFKIGGKQHTLKVRLPPASSPLPTLANIISFPEKK